MFSLNMLIMFCGFMRYWMYNKCKNNTKLRGTGNKSFIALLQDTYILCESGTLNPS